MARTSALDSANAQFFINLVDNPSLDATPGTSDGYAVFADVVDGMDVMDEMAVVPTGSRGSMNDVPIDDVVIVDVRRGALP